MADGTASSYFHGEFHHTLDNKGRVILPARYRERFTDGLRITRGQDKALRLWTLEDFDDTVQALLSLPEGSSRARMRRRLFLSAHMDAPDAQGRIILPGPLREYAELQRELTVVGNGNHLEVWDRGNWQAYLHAAEGVLAEDYDDDLVV